MTKEDPKIRKMRNYKEKLEALLNWRTTLTEYHVFTFVITIITSFYNYLLTCMSFLLDSELPKAFLPM